MITTERLFKKFAAEAGLSEASEALADAASNYCSFRERGIVDGRLAAAEVAMFAAKAKRSVIVNNSWVAANEWAKTDAEPK